MTYCSCICTPTDMFFPRPIFQGEFYVPYYVRFSLIAQYTFSITFTALEYIWRQ